MRFKERFIVDPGNELFGSVSCVSARFINNFNLFFVHFSINYKLLFDLDVGFLSKADRLTYSSIETQTMLITGASFDQEENVKKYRVDSLLNGSQPLVMSPQWLNEFVFQVVVDKKHVTENVMNVFEKDPIELPAWDPLGRLIS